MMGCTMRFVCVGKLMIEVLRFETLDAVESIRVVHEKLAFSRFLRSYVSSAVVVPIKVKG